MATSSETIECFTGDWGHPSEKWWTNRQLGWWNSQLFMESHNPFMFQSTNQWWYWRVYSIIIPSHTLWSYMEKNMFQTTKQYSINHHWSTKCHWSKTYPLCFMPTCQSGLIMPNEAGGFEHCSVFVLFLQCARSELSWPNAQRQPQCSPSDHSPKFDSFGRFGKCPFPQWIPYN